MAEYEFKLVDSLVKVFPENDFFEKKEIKLSILKGEVPAFQLVYKKIKGESDFEHEFSFEVKGIPTGIRIREVEPVASAFPCYEDTDDNYLTTKPGLFPDLIRPKEDSKIIPLAGLYKSLWIDFPDTSCIDAGNYKGEVHINAVEEITTGIGTLKRIKKKELYSEVLTFELDVAGLDLPEQKLIHTEWFHCDCLANYYKTDVFSDLHWEIIEKQIRMAGKELNINMLLTPVFTPALDTAINGERTTVQLVDIVKNGDNYSFEFSKLEKWCYLCKKNGIDYIEIPHFFTQWGAKATPKIVASVKGVTEKIFGWHILAESKSYRSFLEQFVPALQDKLQDYGFDKEHVYFHISDEPSEKDEDGYQRAYRMVSDLLDGWKIIDALSEYRYYEKGYVKTPIPSSSSIQAFIDHKVPELWVYYCCGQTCKVPNRFFAMPSARNRIMGVLMYLYDIKGFLHWGYNFYNSRFSKELIDPFFDTHGKYAFPSGDPFLVYPGTNGEPWSSIRAEVQREGLYDMCALQKLEELVGRKRVIEIIYDGQKEPFDFENYPTESNYLIELRERINDEIKRVINTDKRLDE